MNKLTKIGVSALAGSLAMTAVHAAEGSVSVSTGLAYHRQEMKEISKTLSV